MIKKLLFPLAGLVLAFSLHSQETARPPQSRCGTMPPPVEWDSWFNAKVENYKNLKAQNKATDFAVTIPVVVHVIHGGQFLGTYPNITQAQVLSQIKVLNDDFAGQGLNSFKLAVTGFSTVGAANTGITFCLAELDPDGNPLSEPGIDRINYTTMGWQNPANYGAMSTFQPFMENTVKPATIWDPTRYFNIWITDASNSLFVLGYATFPGGSTLSGLPGNLGTSVTDGIWVWTRCFGNGVGTLDPTYNRGRTAVHETGHWLGLRHIGGDASNAAGDCNATDYCNDTPPQKGGFGSGTNGQNFGSPGYPLHVNICGSPFGDMFMNFMDYCDDFALYMFTPDQSTRMQTALQNGWYRVDLAASSSTLCTGLPMLDVSAEKQACVSDSVVFVTQSSGLAATNYSWTANPSTGVGFGPSNTFSSPSVGFPGPGTYTIAVTASNVVGFSKYESVVTIGECVGIKKNRNESLLYLSPNPASDQLKVITDIKGSDSQPVSIKVMNTLGGIVCESDFSSSETGVYNVNTGSLPDGIYFVSVQNGTEIILKRLVIAR